MIGLHTAAEVRAAEQPVLAATPEGTLMQRAATGLATVCLRLLGRSYGVRVTLLVGAGNNGGDALFAGAALARRGALVTAVLLDPARAHRAGLAALRRAGGRAVDAGAGETGLDRADLVLDGIVGIGGSGGLRPPAAALAEQAARGPGITVAVDVPSGVDASTGAVDGPAFAAMHTVTFGAVKLGLVVGGGRGHAGEVHLIDIGLDLPPAGAHQLTDADVAARYPAPTAGDDKYSQGVVGVVAGSATYPGAGVLCTGAALRTRPGLVRYAGTAAAGVHAAWPEAIVTEGRPGDAGRVQAWVVGPGMGTDDDARSVLTEVLATDLPVIVDADGLTLLAQQPEPARERSAPTVLTPHDREFARFGFEVSGDRVGSARRLAAELGAVVLLKGDATVVAAPSGRAFVNATGTPWLATAGTGDVLSGIIGALLATGLDPAEAAAAGAHLHGRTGQLAAARGPIVAGDLVRRLPDAVRRVRGLPADHLGDSGT
jgi:ADP-dependent NAD(P)H-hydrate dehydratase / NAD(P)H-hydrate epimerase